VVAFFFGNSQKKNATTPKEVSMIDNEIFQTDFVILHNEFLKHCFKGKQNRTREKSPRTKKKNHSIFST